MFALKGREGEQGEASVRSKVRTDRIWRGSRRIADLWPFHLGNGC